MSNQRICAVILLLVVTLLFGCDSGVKEKYENLLEKYDTLSKKYQTLSKEMERFQQTDNYFYQKAIDERNNKEFESSSVLLTEMIERFPESNLIKSAKETIMNNKIDYQNEMFDKAKSLHDNKEFDSSNQILDLMIEKYPNTKINVKIKNLRSQNVKMKQQWEKEQEKERKRIAEQRARASAELEILSWSWSGPSYGYAKASGQVKNISDHTLDNVVAVVTFYDSKGTFITSDNALIEYNPILPNQTSPFEVMATWNPAMNKAFLEFKHLMGGTIATYRKK